MITTATAFVSATYGCGHTASFVAGEAIDPACRVCYPIPESPRAITGFTLELDGNHELVERVYRQAMNEVQAIIEAHWRRESSREFTNLLGPVPYLPPPPIQGKITLRGPIVDAHRG